MGRLLEFPPEVLCVLTRFLDFFDLLRLRKTGSWLLNTKLLHGGVTTVALDRDVSRNWLFQKKIEKGDVASQCACSLDRLTCYHNLEEIAYAFPVHSCAWHLRLLRHTWNTLQSLQLTLPCSLRQVLECIIDRRIVFAETMPCLERLELDWSISVHSVPNFELQYLIGTLPDTLLSFGAFNDGQRIELDANQMMCAFPDSLEILDLNVSWSPRQPDTFDSDFKLLENLFSEMSNSLRFKPDSKFGDSWKKWFPETLATLHIISPPSLFMNPILLEVERLSELPRRLTSYEFSGSNEKFESSLFPPTLISLKLKKALIAWESDTLTSLKHFEGASTPTVAMPSLEKLTLTLERTFSGLSVVPGSMPLLNTLHIPSLILRSPSRCQMSEWILSEPLFSNLRVLSLHQILHAPSSPPQSSTPQLENTSSSNLRLPPNLEVLNLATCPSVQDVLMRMLPSTLTHLEIRDIYRIEGRILKPGIWPPNLRTLLLFSSCMHGAVVPVYDPAAHFVTKEWADAALESFPKSLTRLQFDAAFYPLVPDSSMNNNASHNLIAVQKEIPMLNLVHPMLSWQQTNIENLCMKSTHVTIPTLLQMPSRDLMMIEFAAILILDMEEMLLMPKLLDKFPSLKLDKMPVIIPTCVYKASCETTSPGKMDADATMEENQPKPENLKYRQLIHHAVMEDPKYASIHHFMKHINIITHLKANVRNEVKLFGFVIDTR